MRDQFARLLRVVAEWVAPEPDPEPPITPARPAPVDPWAVFRHHHSEVDWSCYIPTGNAGGSAYGVAYREAA